MYAAGRGPLDLRRPSTVVTNSHPAQREMVPDLLFLERVAARLPRGAAVAVVERPKTSPEDRIHDYLIAIGQLPDSAVITVSAEEIAVGNIPLAPYAACLGGELPAERYGLLFRDGERALYRRIR